MRGTRWGIVRRTSLIHSVEIKYLLNLPLIMLLLIIIHDVHQYEDTDHGNAIFRTGLRSTRLLVVAGSMVPSGVMLVKPAIH